MPFHAFPSSWVVWAVFVLVLQQISAEVPGAGSRCWKRLNASSHVSSQKMNTRDGNNLVRVSSRPKPAFMNVWNLSLYRGQSDSSQLLWCCDGLPPLLEIAPQKQNKVKHKENGSVKQPHSQRWGKKLAQHSCAITVGGNMTSER